MFKFRGISLLLKRKPCAKRVDGYGSTGFFGRGGSYCFSRVLFSIEKYGSHPAERVVPFSGRSGFPSWFRSKNFFFRAGVKGIKFTIFIRVL